MYNRKSILIIFFSISLNLIAQEYIVKKYSVREGMPSNQVFDLFQSSDGMMWFASPIGVFTYDGTSWFLHSNRPDFDRTEYKKIREDENGNIWVLPTDVNYPITYFDGNEWKKLPPIYDFRVEDKLAADFDLCIMNGKTCIGLINQSCEFFFYDGEKWTHIDNITPGTYGNFYSINHYNDAFLISSDNGLLQFKSGYLKSWHRLNNLLPGGTVYKFNIEKHGADTVILLFGNKWIGEYSNDKFRLISSSIKLSSISGTGRRFYGLARDSKNRIYFCNDMSLFCLDEKEKFPRLINYAGKMRFSGSTTVTIDRENNIWISNLRGVIKLRESLFRNYNADNYLPSDEVSALDVLSNGKVILGQYGSISIIDGERRDHIKFYNYDNYAISVARVMDIMEDSKNRVWLTVFDYGIGQLINNKISWVKKSEKLTFNSIAEDNKGKLYVGTSNGLYKMQRNGQLNRIDGIEGFIRKVRYLSEGMLGICSGGEGIYINKDDVLTNYKSTLQNANSTFTCYLDPRFGLLVGTKAGLFHIDGDSLKAFISNGFSIENPVYMITRGKGDIIWFGTDNGITKWDGNTSRNYSSGDGFLGTEVNRSAGELDLEGRLWVGSNLGASQYIEEEGNYVPVPPLTSIVKVVTNTGDIIPTGQHINLPYDFNFITVHYRGLSFIDEDLVQYKVALTKNDGTVYDSYITHETTARFPNLNPGEYKFSLQAINPDGIHSLEARELKIVVESPFYYSVWFILPLLSASAGVFYFIFVFVSQKKYASILELEVSQRTEELSAKIIQLKKVERALTKSEEEFRNVFQNSEIGMFKGYPDGRVILANPAVYRILGYSSDTNPQQLNLVKDLEMDNEASEEYIKILKTEGRVINYQHTIQRNGRRPTYINENTKLYLDDDGQEIIEGTIEDITEKKLAEKAIIEAKEQAENSDKLKSQFLAQMSHEIRTPINSILNFSTLLREELIGSINEDLEFGFSIIQNAGKRIMRTIDLLLNMSELQTGTYDLNSKRFDLRNEILDNLYFEFKVTAREKGLYLRIIDETEIGGEIYADEYTVGQIFNNLLDNALKYTEKGGIEIKMCKKNSYQLQVEIIDTGIGISEEYLPKIFHPFTQEEQGYTRKYEGNGLGLALVKQYCDLNGIHIDINSKKEVGTTFTLLFPAAK